jgi:hypothetical protein
MQASAAINGNNKGACWGGGAGMSVAAILGIHRILRSHSHPFAGPRQKVLPKLRIVFAKVCQSNALVGELDALPSGCHSTIPYSKTALLHAAPSRLRRHGGVSYTTPHEGGAPHAGLPGRCCP